MKADWDVDSEAAAEVEAASAFSFVAPPEGLGGAAEAAMAAVLVAL